MSALPEPIAALRRLARRRAVRLVREASAETGVPFVLVGGAVRDALLGLPAGDLDLSAPADGARALAEALARRAGTRVVEIGRPPRRVLHVPLGRSSVDVWPAEGNVDDDLRRRDFTVNAVGLSFPGATLVAPEGALEDFSERRLRLPREGVLLEDPLRVARAARFLARLPGFRLDVSARAELARAARRLPAVAPERRLAELDAILAAGPRAAATALARLEEWGALGALLPGVPAPARRRGAALLRAAAGASPVDVLRTLVLAPAGAKNALRALDALRASRRDQRLAAALLALPAPARAPSRRDAVLLLRRSAPFSLEAVAFVEAAFGGRGRALARAARALLLRRGALARILRPRRPVDAAEVETLLGLTGPELGRALARLDEALATGEARGRREARALLASRPPRPLRRFRAPSGSV